MRWICVAVAALLWSCESDVRVAFAVDDGALSRDVAAAVVSYDLIVAYGAFPDGEPLSCAGLGERSPDAPGLLVVHEEEIAPDELDEVRYLTFEAGSLLYYVRAWDSGCRVIAEGCHQETVDLRVRGYEPTVVLGEVPNPVSHCD